MTTDYSKTVNLPRTRFPMKADLARREPGIQEYWDKAGVYEKMLAGAKEGSYVLHDGPPYANGHIHIGHALNKILKDIAVKSRALTGKKTPFVPGWDCHGLPIETALLKEKKKGKREVSEDVPGFRRDCREFAERFIGLQRGEFRRLGAFGEWERPYTTMSAAYEARVVRAFGELYRRGYIYKGTKAVGWCFHCETALAEAEVEYKDKLSPSVYVALPVVESAALKGKGLEKGAEALVWTTTPWTLPANMAVAFHPDLEYVLVEVRLPGRDAPRRLLLAKARLEAVMAELGAESFKELGRWLGRDLAPRQEERRHRVNLVCRAPFAFAGGESAGVLADYVTAEDGTGIVHTAPGHGADDFETGQWYRLKAFSPVDGAGRFTVQAGELRGLRVFPDGNERVLADLKARGLLLREAEVSHSYPHCWRCKNPTIFRATEQWFLKVGHEGLREKLLKAVEEVRWIPPEGKNRISGMILNRPDWCISRQRFWGIPIPILYCRSCSAPFAGEGAFEAIEKRMEREGTDFWFERRGKPVVIAPAGARAVQREAAKSLPAEDHESVVWDFMPAGARCACGGAEFIRETDILDVWVDSGASWLAAMGGAQSDLYLEGSDQHRGWFMSSLVLSVALTGRAPFKAVLTHGFVLDEKGRAMHKSLGNVVSPQEAAARFGADVLRLWVALSDWSDDVRLSDKLLEVPAEAYRKIRNTLRYLLGNLADFDPAKDALPVQALAELDRYVLERLGRLSAETVKAYEDFRLRDAARALADFCNLELSSFYLDACKDKLYTLAPGAPERRSAQTAMFHALRSLAVLIAPILSFTAEETWQELRRVLQEELKSSEALPESVFLARFPEPVRGLGWSGELDARWRALLEIRRRVNKAIAEKRAAGAIGSSLQARVRLQGGPRELLEDYKSLWPELLIVSQVEIAADGGELSVEVSKAEGKKCARCWRYQSDVGTCEERPELCSRCVGQLPA